MSKSENPLVVKFRQLILSRGASGIKGIGRMWGQIDDDGNKKLSYEEFKKCIVDHNIDLNRDETAALFRLFDQDGSGQIDFNEFLFEIRPPLNANRLGLIHRAFEKLDKSNDKKVSVDDLKGVYNVKMHPKYLNGEWTEEQCLKKFLDQFEVSQHKDGIITYDEFVNYYAGVSSSIDSDAYFDIMMRQAWKI